jgi:hypothetical protein
MVIQKNIPCVYMMYEKVKCLLEPVKITDNLNCDEIKSLHD